VPLKRKLKKRRRENEADTGYDVVGLFGADDGLPDGLSPAGCEGGQL
jgi:hypothetical protein